jgi:hypothetical protein
MVRRMGGPSFYNGLLGLYSTMGHWVFCSITGHQMFYICSIIFILLPFNRYFSCIYMILDISIATVQKA